MPHFIVVYQYGKVASTSLVATLNGLPEVEAVQAHFLGRDSLREMVSLIVDPATSDYFHRHQVGQFVENARTTRTVNAYRQRRITEGNLAIISLYRNPFEWFRSSVLQDITGYLPALERMRLQGDNADGKEAHVELVLARTLCAFSEIVSEFGGIDVLVEQVKMRSKALARHPLLKGSSELLAMFYMMLRPFSWFDAHYYPAIGYSLDDLAEIEAGVLYRKVGWASLLVLRYEDLAAQLRVAADRLGIGPVDALVYENRSDAKPMSECVRAAFASEPAQALRAQFAATEYARRFGYT